MFRLSISAVGPSSLIARCCSSKPHLECPWEGFDWTPSPIARASTKKAFPSVAGLSDEALAAYQCRPLDPSVANMGLQDAQLKTFSDPSYIIGPAKTKP